MFQLNDVSPETLRIVSEWNWAGATPKEALEEARNYCRFIIALDEGYSDEFKNNQIEWVRKGKQ